MMNATKQEDLSGLENFDPDDAATRFEFISMVITSKFLIKSGFDVSLAEEGNEIELSKMTLIILSNGAGLEIKEVIDAFEALGKADYELFQEFYALVEQQKLKFPPNSIESYETFLFMKFDRDRKSLAKGGAECNHNSMLSDSFQTDSPARKLMSSEQYLLSPMSKASLSSPREKSFNRKKIEETYFNEKKRLEKEISNKDNLIYELNAEISEQRAEMEEIKKKMEESERKQVEFNK
jgi:hypothetical protein